MSNPSSSAWTTHGHPIPGVTLTGPRPGRIARCGGVRLCGKCKGEALAGITPTFTEENTMTAITVTTTSKDRASTLERDEWQYPEAAALALAQAPGQLLALARVQEYVTVDNYQGGVEHVYEWTFIPKAPTN